MKILSTLIGLFFLSLNFQAKAQSATNFTEEDCEGVSYTLFDELDEGKIIVIAWVMPCGSCSYFGSRAYDAVQTFSESHPGKIEFYLTDDYANTSCSSISSWGNTNSMENHVAFSSSAINMGDYGTDGMPKVVVLAGTDHSVLYNKNNGSISFDGVVEAITTALTTVGIDETQLLNNSLSIFPNPSNGLMSVEFNLPENAKLEVFNLLGDKVLEVNLDKYIANKKTTIEIDLSTQNDGMYLVSLSSDNHKETQIITIGNTIKQNR